MSDDLLPFVRLVEYAKPGGRNGTELFLACGHKVYFAVGYRPDMKSAPCAKCVAAFKDEEDRLKWDRKVYALLQETRKWVECPDVKGRLDSALETLRRRVENPQETLNK